MYKRGRKTVLKKTIHELKKLIEYSGTTEFKDKQLVRHFRVL